MRLAEFGCGAHPARPDHEKNLHQNQIAQPERLLQTDTVAFDFALGPSELNAVGVWCHLSEAVQPDSQCGCTAATTPFSVIHSLSAAARCEILDDESFRPL